MNECLPKRGHFSPFRLGDRLSDDVKTCKFRIRQKLSIDRFQHTYFISIKKWKIVNFINRGRKLQTSKLFNSYNKNFKNKREVFQAKLVKVQSEPSDDYDAEEQLECKFVES